MEHIWQSSYKHAPSSFDVTEHVSGFTPVIDHRAIPSLPFDDISKKPITICQRMNPGHLKENLPQLPGVGSFREATAPGQTLSLNMDQASLNDDLRPKLSEYLYHVGVTIHRKARWIQSIRNQAFEELHQLRLRTLGDTILPCYERMGTSIHQGCETIGTMEESTIKDKVVTLSQVQHRRWYRLFQLVIDHTVKLSQTVVTLVCQLSRRETFDNPKPEPFLLFPIFSLRTPPAGPTT